MTDPISDLIIRIKNALMASHDQLALPNSKAKKAVAEILAKEGYITSVEVNDKEKHSQLVIKLKYVGKTPAITGVKRLSKPGRRLYSSSSAVPKTLGGYGITIISTNKGVMTGVEARKQNVGGELLCQIW